MQGNLLIVDDQPTNLELLEGLLAAEGYEVRAVTSGAAALQTVAARRPELILLDIAMPEMDGFEVCRRLKANAATVAIPVLFLSAHAETAEKLLAFEAGGQDYITKPFATQEVLARVRTHLKLFRMESNLQAEVNRALAERADAYAALQALSQRLVEVQEAERRHLARELHDEIGQKLTHIKMQLERLEAPAAARQPLLAMVQQLTEQVRNLSLELRPAILDDLGLLAALLWLCDHVTAIGIQTEFKYTAGAERRFPPEVEITAYRTAQEALTNIARYAGVPRATVYLWAEADKLGLQIEDAGAGFDVPAVLAAHQTGGLPGMQERARLCGGQVSIESTPGVGTVVTLELPLLKDAPEREPHADHNRAGR